MKRLITLLVLLVSAITLNAEIVSGSCGTNLSYQYNTDNGTLTINGSGAMDGYDIFNPSPWNQYKAKIKKIIFNEGIAGIGMNAFDGCFNIETIAFSTSIKSIKNSAFKDCIGLKSITIPRSVDDLDPRAFNGCDNVSELIFEAGCTQTRSTGLTNVTTLIIPNTVTTISGLGGLSKLKTVNIPSSVTTISSGAFSGCASLSSLQIPASVKTIGEDAFKNCYLAASNFTNNSSAQPNGLTIVDSEQEDGLIILGNTVVRCRPCATSVTIPSNVVSINPNAFERCSWLTHVTIADGINNIDGSIFKGCSALESVSIPSTVASIGDYAFEGCKQLKSVSIPSSVTSIGGFAFSECLSLSSITIPSGTTSIGKDAFKGCYMSAENIQNYSSFDLTKYGMTICDVEQPDGLLIKDKTIVFCRKKTTSVVIPDDVTKIGDYAFLDCHSLSSVTISYNVKDISYWAFRGCLSLKSIIIPEGVTNIRKAAFYGCISLESISIPSSVKDIGVNAFTDCVQLNNISCFAEVPPTCSDNSFNTYGTLHVLPSYGDAYRAADYWRYFNIVEDAEWDINGELENLKNAYATLQNNYNSVAKELAELKQANTNLQRDYDNISKEVTEQMNTYTALLSSYNNATKELDEQKNANDELLTKYDNISKELTAYKLGDLNGDGVTDILDVEALIKLSNYSSSESALATLVEETGITLTEISEQYGDVEFYTLDGKKVSKPSQSGVYFVKKNGQTKMIVVKK